MQNDDKTVQTVTPGYCSWLLNHHDLWDKQWTNPQGSEIPLFPVSVILAL